MIIRESDDFSPCPWQGDISLIGHRHQFFSLYQRDPGKTFTKNLLSTCISHINDNEFMVNITLLRKEGVEQIEYGVESPVWRDSNDDRHHGVLFHFGSRLLLPDDWRAS